MPELRRYVASTPLITRTDLVAREIDVRLFEWDVPADLGQGDLEAFSSGTRIHTAGGPVKGPARLDHADPPFGQIAKVWSQKDGPYATLKASRTQLGDTALELAADGTYQGPSVGFVPTEPTSWAKGADGRRVAMRDEMDLREVSLTWRPAHQSAAIVAVRSTEGPGMGNESNQAPIAAPAAPASGELPEGDIRQAVAKLEASIATRFDQLEERARKNVDVPAIPRAGDNQGVTGRWVKAALMTLAGDRVPDLELRALDDVITSDNLGVVPKNIRSEILGIIDPARPFLNSTRKVDAGPSGMTQTFPIITQRPVVGVQSTEKTELASQLTKISTVDFEPITIGGAGDLSLQLLKRSSPSFLQLWLDLLAEQFAIMSDAQGVGALLAADVIPGTGAFDPATFKYGEAFANAAAVSPSLQLRPDRIWLSTDAFVAMMDARTPTGGGGTPMFPGLVQLEGIQSNAGGGPFPIRLAPVLVPALDGGAVDVVIGPSRGFAWAEDGTYQLQADVPAYAGRDVGLAGIDWFMPVYPGAFTTYALGA